MSIQLLPHLQAVLQHERKQRKGKVRHVAYAADVSEGTVYNFERGNRKTWPDDTDGLVNAYATVLNIGPVGVWQEALEHLSAETRTATSWFERRAHRDRRVTEQEPRTRPERRRRA